MGKRISLSHELVYEAEDCRSLPVAPFEYLILKMVLDRFKNPFTLIEVKQFLLSTPQFKGDVRRLNRALRELVSFGILRRIRPSLLR